MPIHSARLLAPAFAAVAVASLLAAAPANAAVDGRSGDVVGHVYETTNAAAGNAVQVFDRLRDGRLRVGATVPTGGHGLGSSLASQDGLVRDGNLLFAVNGGDDTVSTLAITDRGLVRRDVAPSGGDLPVSVTVRHGIVYVLNQNSETISGLRVSSDGHLQPLPHSTKALSKSGATPTAAAQVSFTPDGRSLVVTHKGDQTIDTFAVRNGYAGTATPHHSAGVTPYGFDFDRRGDAIVSEAGPSAVSSYSVNGNRVRTISASVSDQQAAACWLVVTRDYAFTVNAASASISSYRISSDGRLHLIASVAATTSAGGSDAALSPDGKFLYVRLSNGSVASYAIHHDGTLTKQQDIAGAATAGTAGLAAN
ncbi:beta-propeller fold lactonase family protein [Kribbella sp. NPDC049584]|uniref:lactonase family protein n=1 Tax=Kribbella sp. NPDC049584 TaxID=3154833 RepID=UPI00341A5A7F